MADFPELRALDRDVAAQILSEAIEAMKLKGEQSAYRSVVEGHGVLRIFCLVVVMSILVVALEVVPVALHIDAPYLRLAKYGVLIVFLPLVPYFKARRRQRLRPYILAILKKREGGADCSNA